MTRPHAMTSGETLLRLCEMRKIVVRLGEDGKPRVSGPPEELTPALLGVLRNYRLEILQALADRKQADAASHGE